MLMGDDSEIPAKGIGRINIDNGYFNNVLYVPDIATNLLFVYQMAHKGLEKRVTFTQYDVEISEICTRKGFAVGIVDHESRMYKFSHFLHYSSGNEFLSHAIETINIWNERFRHLNYIYIQYLSKENMVEGLPKAHARDALLGSMKSESITRGRKEGISKCLN